MKKIIATIAISILLLVTAGLSAQTSASLETEIKDLNDAQFSTESFNSILKQYKGKVVYLDFWASWCGPCKKEMPYSQTLKQKLDGKDVAFVYLSTDKNGTSWTKMIDQMQLTGDHYRASPALKQEIVDRFNLQYIPRYVLINKEGKVADNNAKRPSDPMIFSDIDKLLL